MTVYRRRGSCLHTGAAERRPVQARTHTGRDTERAAPAKAPAPTQAAKLGLAPPPGLAEPSPRSEQPEEESKMFAEMLRERPLPETLAGDVARLERFESALLSSVEGLYRDRLATTLGEVDNRMRSCGWLAPQELAGILSLAARKPEHFRLLPPSEGEPPRILLCSTPPWFTGFVDVDTAGDDYSADVWLALQAALAEPSLPRLKGGVAQAALQMHRQSNLPDCLRRLSLGEWHHVLQLALGQRGLLCYSTRNGGLLEPCKTGTAPQAAATAQEAPQAGATAQTSEALRLTQVLASGPLPAAWKDEGELQQKRQSLRGCIDCLYRERLQPTLREIQQRLLSMGWSQTEARAAALLCSREPEVYEIVPPTGGQPGRILLRVTPPGFRGFLPTTGQGQSLPREEPAMPQALEGLGKYLAQDKPVLKGGIEGAAENLRQQKMPEFQTMSMGELRKLILHAVSDQKMLAYSGSNLRPTQAVLGERAADGRIYSQI